MTVNRSYDDGCATAHALDLVGERWAILVVRELMLGPKRFTDLRAGLPGISPNVLTLRLGELEHAGVLQRRRLAPPAPAQVYELTPWGRELEPAIQALGRWGARSPTMALGRPLSVDAFVMSLRTMYDGRRAGAAPGRVALRIGDERFVAAFSTAGMDLARDARGSADAEIEGGHDAMAAVVYGGVKLVDATRAGQLVVTGDKALARRFVSLFPLPAAADTAPNPP